MTDREKQVGFNQRIRLKWLEQTANLVLAGNDKEAIETSLQDLLKDMVSIGGNSARGNREKCITILMRTWGLPSNDLERFQVVGLELIRSLPKDLHVAVHWGMVLATYPFWGTVAEQVGRLLKLQGKATASQVQRRIAEQFGERETVHRATRRILRTYVDWGALSETEQKGIYRPGVHRQIDDAELVLWLIEAQLHAEPSRRNTLCALTDALSIFPFRLAQLNGSQDLAISDRLEIVSDGSGVDVVLLRSG